VDDGRHGANPETLIPLFSFCHFLFVKFVVEFAGWGGSGFSVHSVAKYICLAAVKIDGDY